MLAASSSSSACRRASGRGWSNDASLPERLESSSMELTDGEVCPRLLLPLPLLAARVVAVPSDAEDMARRGWVVEGKEGKGFPTRRLGACLPACECARVRVCMYVCVEAVSQWVGPEPVVRPSLWQAGRRWIGRSIDRSIAPHPHCCWLVWCTAASIDRSKLARRQSAGFTLLCFPILQRSYCLPWIAFESIFFFLLFAPARYSGPPRRSCRVPCVHKQSSRGGPCVVNRLRWNGSRNPTDQTPMQDQQSQENEKGKETMQRVVLRSRAPLRAPFQHRKIGLPFVAFLNLTCDLKPTAA
jgi:hypothetical protein